MRDNRTPDSITPDMTNRNRDSFSLGWLKLYIIGADSSPSSRTVYIQRHGKTYAVLHTDTTGGTKAVNLPADKVTGSDYTLMLDNGDTKRITVYPYVVNVHYIDR